LQKALDLARLGHRLGQLAAGEIVADRAQDAAGWRHGDRKPRVGIEDWRADPIEAIGRERAIPAGQRLAAGTAESGK